MQSNPSISIVMVTDDTYETCRRTIGYLLLQTAIDRIEMIIVGPSRDQINADQDELAKFHSYQIVEVGKVVSVAQTMAAGVIAAKAPYVTYAEEHGFPPPNLAEVLIREMNEGGHVALGWAMAPANPGLVSWAHIYAQFGDAVAPLQSGPATRLGGHHGAYRRDLLIEYGDQLPHVVGCEAVLHGDLNKRGVKMYMTGEVVALHTQVSDFPSYFKHEYIAQRAFAAARMDVMNWSIWRRLLYVAGSPLIPFLRLRRSLHHLQRTGRFGELMPNIAFVMLAGNVAGAIGEALGYMFGADDRILSQRMAVELDRYSYVRASDREAKPAGSPAAQSETTE